MPADTERPRPLDPPSQANKTPSLPDYLLNTLSLDLEVNPNSTEILALAAIRPDTGEEFKVRGPITSRHWQILDRMAENAAHLTGHNIAAFDIHHLRAAAPHLNLLRKPVLDTLMLNALAFPRYPYHRLVKHYKDGGLVRSTRNDPLLDSRLTMQALQGQFVNLKKARPDLLAAWHWLATIKDGEAYDTCFAQVRGRQRPIDEQGLEAIQQFLADRSCRSQTTAVMEEVRQDPWPLAYVMAWLDAEGTSSAIPPWVVYNFPATSHLTTRLRERNCGNKNCGWCQDRNDPKRELKRWFRFDSFRAEPAGADGVPLQERLTSMAMEDRNTLGILPTGTGKSICYQLPALSRYEKTGSPHGGSFTAGGADGRPDSRPGGEGHHQRRHRQQPSLPAGTQRRPGQNPTRRSLNSDTLAREPEE